MIISASRRTDIPAYYSDWFFRRIREGSVLVRNPMAFHQISHIDLTPDVVDGIVFWTKNPLPMLDRLRELNEYMYYFQFTVTPYGESVEPNLPSKNDVILPSFKRLSDSIGADRVIWRYDPILLNEKYTSDYHILAFGKIAKALHGYTKKVTISFIDEGYRGVKGNSKELALQDVPPSVQTHLGAQLAEIARGYGLSMAACAEKIDLRPFGIEPARCIDDRLLGSLLGTVLHVGKDKNQRPECGCVASVDIGMYNTCLANCRYCYANYNKRAAAGNYARHDPYSALISGKPGEGDTVKAREAKPLREAQMRLFNS